MFRLSALLLALLPCAVSAASSGAIPVSDGLGQSQSPHLACGPDGAVHVLWRNNVTGVWEIYCRTFRDTAFTPVRRISGLNSNALSPVAAADTDGRLHAAWSVEINGTYEVVYTAAGPAGDFSAPLNISTDRRASTEPCLAIDPAGGIHLAWRNATDDGDDIFYRSRLNGEWGGIVNLSRLRGVSRAPALAVRGTDPAVLWTDDTYGSWNVFMRRSAAGKWLRREDVYAGHQDGEFPAVCAGGVALHMAWVLRTSVRSSIRYRALDGDGWSAEKELSDGDAGPAAPRLAAGTGGTVHAVWTDTRQGRSALRYRSIGPDGMAPAAAFGEDGGDDPADPDVAAAPGGAVWCAWRAKQDGRWRIFMQRLQTENR